jgi:hypothetical protein
MNIVHEHPRPDGWKFTIIYSNRLFPPASPQPFATKVTTEKAINQLNNFHCRHICGDDGIGAILPSLPPSLLLAGSMDMDMIRCVCAVAVYSHLFHCLCGSLFFVPITISPPFQPKT